MGARLAGIARHDRPKGPMETLHSVPVTRAPALADVQGALDWHHARRNLLLAGLRLPREKGQRVAIGPSLVIEILDECDPCERMEALIPGLRAAMTPDWRGGFLGRVVQDGDVAVGDQIRIV